MAGARFATYFSYSNSKNTLKWYKIVLPQKEAVMFSMAQCKKRGVEGGKSENQHFGQLKFRLPSDNCRTGLRL